MNIYFTASVAGRAKFEPYYQDIIRWCQRHGHQIQADHILTATEAAISHQSGQDRSWYQEQLEKWLSSCDCVVVEASFPSISVGFEISLALHWNKPILILYSQGEPPSLFYQFQEEKILCQKYTSATLPEVLHDFLEYAKDHSDVRYTFSLPSYLARYLDRAAAEAHLPKAAYLRQLLEKDCGCTHLWRQPDASPFAPRPPIVLPRWLKSNSVVKLINK